MTTRHTEADARIAIDDRLRQAGWDPLDKSMVGTEVQAADSLATNWVVDRSRARPFETHAPVYDLEAAAGAFGPDRAVGAAGDEIGWAPVPESVRLTREHFVVRVSGQSMEPSIPDGSHCLFRTERGGSRQGKLVLVWQRGTGGGMRLFPRQAERYRWFKWRFRSGNDLRDFVRDEVFAYMASLVKDEPQVAEYFRDAVLDIVDPNVLKQVIDELDSIDFRKLGPDVKGDIFEYLLTHLGQSALNGQFRTPAPGPGLHGRDGRSRARRHRLRPRLRHRWIPDRCGGLRARSLQR